MEGCEKNDPSQYLNDIINEGEKAVEEDLTHKSVWCPHDALIWSQAEVISLCEGDDKISKNGNGREYMVAFPDSPNVLKRFTVDRMHKVDPTHILNLDNLCDMNDMHEAPLLDLLRRRFFQNQIYTYTGDVLISVNPYERFVDLYSSPIRFFSFKKLFQSSNAPETIFSSLDVDNDSNSAPHVYQIANKSFTALSTMNDRGDMTFSNQSIIISGESGAGKTENCKYVLNFLIEANNALSAKFDQQTPVQSNSTNTKFEEHLKALLVESSVVLEAFGNAKTVRNDNSSRFGKYIKLIYKPSEVLNSPDSSSSHASFPTRYAKLVSASTETFLLEKSRLSSVGLNERCYHIFYQLVAGMAVQCHPLRESFDLQRPVESFAMLFQGQCGANYEDVTEFQNTTKALKVLQCSPEEISEIWKLLAIILHLGNFTYQTIESSGTDSVRLDCTTTSMVRLAELLGLDSQPMLIALTTQQLIVARRSSLKVKVLNATETANNVLALMKCLYSKLFEWLVRKINHCYHAYDTLKEGHSMAENGGFIGILDIFGFEILGINSFEQLCINYTNECLQQQFNEYVFVSEQQMYAKEGLEWSNITFRDNQGVLDLIASPKKPLGLLFLLEEQGMLNRKPDDSALLAAFNAIHDTSSKSTVTKGKVPPTNAGELPSLSSNIYSRSKFGTDAFTLRHFAGEVNYSIEGFLAKNNDSLQDDLMNMLKTTQNQFIRNVMQFPDCSEGQVGFVPKPQEFTNAEATDTTAVADLPTPPVPAPTGINKLGGKKMANSASVSQQFRQQLEKLMQTLRSTSPNYIKCIKPNSEKIPAIFDASLVIQQLRYSGVLEVVRIRREGFPLRISFEEYYSRFEILAKGKNPKEFPPPDQCDFEQAKHCVVILTRENLHSSMYQIGNSLLFLRHNGLEASKNAIKLFYARHAITIQSMYRSLLTRRSFVKLRINLVQIQALWRKHVARSYYLYVLLQIRKIQGLYLSVVLRRRFVQQYAELRAKRKLKSAILVQTHYRRFREQKRFRQLYKEFLLRRLRAAITIQCQCRKVLSKVIFARKLAAWQQKKFTSAIILQSQVRRYLQQKKYEAYCRELKRKQYESALSIQSQFRKYLCVKSYRYLRQTSNAVKIQTQFRRKLAEKHYQWAYCCVVLLQSQFRAILSRRRFLFIRKCAVILQARIRQFLRTQAYDFTRTCAIVLQAQIRCWLQRNRYILSIGGIVAIQSAIRMYLQKRIYANAYISVVLIQNIIRKYLAKTRYHRIRQQVIKLQAQIRCFLLSQQYAMQYVAILAMQSFGRMIIQRRLYQSSVYSIVVIQSIIRKFLHVRRYCHVRAAVTRIQSAVRTHLAYMNYKIQYLAILKLQSFGRMVIASQSYQEILIATIVIQAMMRGKLSRLNYQKQRHHVIKLQSWMRMLIDRFNYYYYLASIITIQSVIRSFIARNRYTVVQYSVLMVQATVRKFISRNRYLKAYDAIVKIQSFIRMANAHNRFYFSVYSAIVIAKYVRRYLAQTNYYSTYLNIVRIQFAAKRFVRNLALFYRLSALHNAARGVQHIGNTNSKYFIITHLTKYPEDRAVRPKILDCCTLFQSLLIGKQIDLIKSLAFTFVDAFDVDMLGRNAAHYIAMYPTMEVLYQIANDLVNSFKYVNQIDTKNIKFGEFDDNDNDNDNDKGPSKSLTNEEESANNQLRQILNLSVGTSTLKSGWLKKKRGGMMWHKRWVVLTEDYLIYYKNPQSINNPKFAIPLTSCTIQRFGGSRDPILEIQSSILEEKKSGFFGGNTKKPMLFLAESEQELQEWLLPLKAVVGIGTLQSSSTVHYVNTDLRALWVGSCDKAQETPLHSLIRSIASSEERDEDHPVDQNLDEPLNMLAWLIEFGCPVNASNRFGETALHLAIKKKADPRIVYALLAKGGDLKCEDDDGITALSLLSNTEPYASLYRQIFQTFTAPKPFGIKTHNSGTGSGAVSTMGHKYVSHGKLKGYSYLGIYFSKQSFNYRVEHLNNPCLIVSCFNGKKQLIEAAREIREPILLQEADQSTSNDPDHDGDDLAIKKCYVLWGQSFHMQTPLENIDSGSYLSIEFRPHGENANIPTSQCQGTVLALQYSVTSDQIDSGLQSVNFSPVESSHKTHNDDDNRSMVMIECVISQRNRMVNMHTILQSRNE